LSLCSTGQGSTGQGSTGQGSTAQAAGLITGLGIDNGCLSACNTVAMAPKRELIIGGALQRGEFSGVFD
jgi:hypothetical protein